MLIWAVWLAILGVGQRGAMAQSAALPRFEAADCPVPVTNSNNVECGYLVVPEDRSRPEGRAIRLPVGIARSRAAQPRPDPVVYLHGGPGMSVVRRVWWWPNSPFRAERDVIVIDQRGAGLSQPALDCPEMRDIPVETLTRNMTFEQAVIYHTERANQCRERLTRQGIDLAMYTNTQSAADLDDLRKVLGYEQWNLFSWSAGTRLALTILRDHPDGVRSAILDSVYMPPSADYYANLMPYAAQTLQRVFEACAADAMCNRTYPDLKGLLFDTVDRLNAEPLTFTVNHPYTGKPFEARMNGPAFVGLLYRALYEEWNIALTPKLIADVRRGNTQALPELLRDPLAEPSLYRLGMNHSIHCSEAAPFTSLEKIDAAWATVDAHFLGFYHFDVNPQAFMRVCKTWPIEPPDPRVNEPVTSDIPALIFMGTFDPASPPVYGKLAAQTLSSSYYVEFPTMGHFAWEYGGTCPKQIALDFLNNPAEQPDTSCINEMPRIRFVTDADIYALPGLYRLIDSIAAEGYTLQNIGPIMVFAALVILAPLMALISLIRRRPKRGAWMLWPAHLFAGLIVSLNSAAIVVVFREINAMTLTRQSLVGYGLPASAAPYMLVPLVAGLIGAGLLLLTAIAWSKRYWTFAGRVYYTLLAVSALGLVGWMAYWSLLPNWS